MAAYSVGCEEFGQPEGVLEITVVGKAGGDECGPEFLVERLSCGVEGFPAGLGEADQPPPRVFGVDGDLHQAVRLCSGRSARLIAGSDTDRACASLCCVVGSMSSSVRLAAVFGASVPVSFVTTSTGAYLCWLTAPLVLTVAQRVQNRAPTRA